jgi:hypothetical protein
MELFTDDIIRQLLASSLQTATLDPGGWRDSGEGPGSPEGHYINWLTFSDTAQSVVEDVRRLRPPWCPLTFRSTAISAMCKPENSQKCQKPRRRGRRGNAHRWRKNSENQVKVARHFLRLHVP